MKNSKRARQNLAACSVIAAAGCLLATRTAHAEVTLVKNDKWEVYTAGRVNAFVGYAFGEAYPISDKSLIGGGVDTSTDRIPPEGGVGVGTISKMRLRSGFLPNVFTIGVRHKLTETTTLKAQLSIWGTIETTGQRKYLPIITDFREGYMEAEGTWGTFRAGRFLSLFSRGITEVDFLYGHGYGVGFWGGEGLIFSGPTAGLIGFGVLAASFSPGLLYATPSFSGFKLSAAIFDPVQLAGSWESTRTIRPEAEATYDLTSGIFKTHLFVNAAYQKLYNGAQNETVSGAGFGGRFEIGNFHIGGGGHYGRGLGLYYALEGSPADHTGAWDIEKPNRFRVIDGYSVLAQYVAGPVDINAGYGISRVHLTDSDKAIGGLPPVNESVIKSQTGISGGIVYHASENLHMDIDYLNAAFKWYAGESQTVHYINSGVTMTW